MKRFPWERAMEIGFGLLKLAPEQFWHMTLPELSSAAHALGLAIQAEALPRRADLDALMARYPDHI